MDIASVFRSKTRKELFRLYFTNPDNEYYLRELERILDIPVSMIRNELTRLEDDGIFRSRKKGNLAYYSLDKSYPLFEELRSIVFKTVGVQGLLKEALKKIKGIAVAFIYGSFAKKGEDARSDIDLFIVGKINESRLLSEMRKLEETLKREINYTVFTEDDIKQKAKGEDSFLMDILENPKIFIAGDADDLQSIY